MISSPFGNRKQNNRTDLNNQMFQTFFWSFVFVLHPFFFSLWRYVAADTSAGSRWIPETRSRWRTFTTWWWPTTRIGLCPTPSPSREPKNCSMLSLCPKCCLLMNSSPSCMTNIPSMYNSTESTSRHFLICAYACTYFSCFNLWSWWIVKWCSCLLSITFSDFCDKTLFTLYNLPLLPDL